MRTLLIAFLLFGLSLPAQTLREKSWTPEEKEQLTKDLNAYMDALTLHDWERMLDLIYPGLFQLSSREEIKKSLENGMNSLDYKMEIQPAANVDIFPQYVEKDGKKYALISYTNNFTMIFNKKESEDDLRFKARMDYVYHKFKKRYPAGQVMQGSEPGIFHFRIPKYMLAVYIPEKQSYTFIDFSNDEAHMETLKKILDSEVVDYFAEKIKKEE